MAQNLNISIQDVQKLCFASSGQTLRFIVGDNNNVGNSISEIICIVVESDPQTVFPKQTINITPVFETRQCTCNLKTRESRATQTIANSNSVEPHLGIEFVNVETRNFEEIQEMSESHSLNVKSNSIKTVIKNEIDLDSKNDLLYNVLLASENLAIKEEISKRKSFEKDSVTKINVIKLKNPKATSDSVSKRSTQRKPKNFATNSFIVCRQPEENNKFSSSQAERPEKKGFSSNLVQYKFHKRKLIEINSGLDTHKTKKSKEASGNEKKTHEIEQVLPCRKVRIGSYQFGPADVTASEKGLHISIPLLTDSSQEIPFLIELEHIQKVQAHFGKYIPVLIYYMSAEIGTTIRRLFEMKDPSGPFFNPASRADRHKLIILFCEGFDPETSENIKSLYDSKLTEISKKLAYEVLERCAP